MAMVTAGYRRDGRRVALSRIAIHRRPGFPPAARCSPPETTSSAPRSAVTPSHSSSPPASRTGVAELRRLRRPRSADVLPRATTPAALRRCNTAETPSYRGQETCRLRCRSCSSEGLPTFHFTKTDRPRGHSADALAPASPVAARDPRGPRRSGAVSLALAGAAAALLMLWSARSTSDPPESAPERGVPFVRGVVDLRRTRGSLRQAREVWEVRRPRTRRLGSPRQDPGAGKAAREADDDNNPDQENDDYVYGGNDHDALRMGKDVQVDDGYDYGYGDYGDYGYEHIQA